MKNRWLSFGLIMMSTVASAGTMGGTSYEPFNGPYFGVGVGYAREKVDYQYFQTNYTYGPIFTNRFNTSKNSVAYRGVFGYGMTLDPIYLGSELTIGAINKETKILPLHSGGASLLKEQQKLNLVAAFLVGTPITDSTLLYVEAGLGTGRYGLTVNDFNDTVVPRYQKQSQWSAEYLVGAGIEQVVMDNISLRLSALFEQAARIKGPEASTVNFGAGTLYNAHMHTYKPSDQSLMLDIIWRMDCP